MNDEPDNALSYRTRCTCGSCWPATAGAALGFAYMFINMHASGYFGNSMYESEPGAWMAIMFPLMIGLLVGAGILVVNSVLFAIVKPATKRMTFVIGMLALPVGIMAGIGIKCLL
jgi:hypothetical protein